jgi:hypothetical protein
MGGWSGMSSDDDFPIRQALLVLGFGAWLAGLGFL